MDAGRLRWAALLDLVYFSLFGKFCLCFGCINFVGHVDQGHRKPVSQEACQVPREPVIDDLSSLYLELHWSLSYFQHSRNIVQLRATREPVKVWRLAARKRNMATTKNSQETLSSWFACSTAAEWWRWQSSWGRWATSSIQPRSCVQNCLPVVTAKDYIHYN